MREKKSPISITVFVINDIDAMAPSLLKMLYKIPNQRTG
jgi:hypothetical protein